MAPSSENGEPIVRARITTAGFFNYSSKQRDSVLLWPVMQLLQLEDGLLKCSETKFVKERKTTYRAYTIVRKS